MKLPGWVFLLLGTGVIGFSKYVESRNDNNLLFFVIVGGLFIIYGLGKEFVTRMRKPKKKEKAERPATVEHERDHRHPAGNHIHGRSPHEQHPHTKPHPHTSHPHKPAHKRCPRCHAVSAANARFCHHCGGSF